MRLFEDVSRRIADPFMRRAWLLAERGRGTTSPNPLVGCVIVRDGEIVGSGFHERAGEPHAEVHALCEAGALALGADVYVTLEPCGHTGRTAPCADALIEARVGRVVIGMRDPGLDSGGGATRLVAAGIGVDFATDPTPFEEQNEAWLHAMRNDRPFIRAKVGVSLDGRVAMQPGVRSTMTGPSGADVTRRLREAADAVVVSAATVNADDPSLTARTADGSLLDRQPVRIVLARDVLPAATARVLTDCSAPTMLLVSEERLADALAMCDGRDVEVSAYGSSDGLNGAFRTIHASGLNDLLVEPGPRLLATLWRDRLMDELVVVTAGGMAGTGAPGLFGAVLAEGGPSLPVRLRPKETGILGDVVATVWTAQSPGLGETGGHDAAQAKWEES